MQRRQQQHDGVRGHGELAGQRRDQRRSNFLGEVGHGQPGTDPFTSFVFTTGAYNAGCTHIGNGDCGTNDEWMGDLTAPLQTGNYSWLWRFSLDSGAHWTYCDLQGNGSNTGLPAFDPTNLAQIQVH